jgi:glyoxylase-like metal-dependent hydrolase (beta-lactamase superfamily II)
MQPLEWRLYEAGYCSHPELATRRGGSLQPCQFPALVALLRHPRHGWILFDTGYSEHFIAATGALPERLYRMVTPVHLHPGDSLAAQLRADGIAAGDIGWIVLSHLHGDHVGGLADFPQARVLVAGEALEDLAGRGRIGNLRIGQLPALLAPAAARIERMESRPVLELPAPFQEFGPARDLFGDGSLLAVPLAGHAAGHHGLLFEDADGPVLLVADASWSSQSIIDNTPPPTLVTAWLGDTAQYRQTLARLHRLHLAAPQVRLVPAHCNRWRPRNKAGT